MGSEEEDRGEDGHYCGGCVVGVEDEKKMCATTEDNVEGGPSQKRASELL